MSRDLEVQDYLRGRIIAKLLEGGVRQQDFTVTEFVDENTITNELDDLFSDMCVWLRDEGYIRFEMIADGTDGEHCVIGARPTSRSISLLDQKIADKRTTRDVISRVDGGSHESYSKLGAFIGGLIGGITTSVG